MAGCLLKPVLTVQFPPLPSLKISPGPGFCFPSLAIDNRIKNHRREGRFSMRAKEGESNRNIRLAFAFSRQSSIIHVEQEKNASVIKCPKGLAFKPPLFKKDKKKSCLFHTQEALLTLPSSLYRHPSPMPEIHSFI